ncbi:maleylpyruvate isomerase family mycothiol-dependent enzyme, partial [Streptomyces sp. NPDC005904]
MSDALSVLDDLRRESEELDRLVAELGEDRWALATPAPGWTVAHQIAHLAWTDRAALLA